MVDSADKSTDWIQQWIAQQRDLLEKAAQAGIGAAAHSATDFPSGAGHQWADLGRTYLDGLLQWMASASVAAVAQHVAGSAPGGDILESWRAAWSNSLAQLSAPGGWSDLLNRTPPLGLLREQAEAWRAVAAAQADCQRLQQELAAVLRRVQNDALTLLEQQVKARAATGAPVQGFHDLYDLWVECSEQVFSTVAHSSAYAHLQGELANAAVRLRARVQAVIEQGLKQFDLPTRSELNSVHLQLRALRQRIAKLEPLVATPKKSAPRKRATSAQPTVAKRRPVKSARSPRSRAR